ncbi:MAG TPA: MBL fold metallo-hydrolase, partial [Stenotrophobium sp.]|nr:MBL fold metallo-hydrolase [Stenotrophobium sp.]
VTGAAHFPASIDARTVTQIREAVTAVLTHGDDLFLVRRQPYLPAFSGYWAFPGGKVDKADSAEALAHPLLRGHPPQLLRALARELDEELGYDLFSAVHAGEVLSVTHIGEATTPDFQVLRYRTHFFRIDLRHAPALTVDQNEAAESAWRPAADWEQRFRHGRLLTAPPTRNVIRWLADDAAHRTALPDFDYHVDVNLHMPWVEQLAGLRILLVRSNTLPPADRTNCFWLGDSGSRRVLIDPSPASREELARLCTVIDEFGVDEVFLTHHHPDHREYANEIARRYRVPIAMSADTRARIERRSPGFFEGLTVKRYAEGDVLTTWLGEKVVLYAVPGHDEGQLAVMPESRSWCIVSDLIQGIGTVVVGGPEGNMRKYFDSLQRVIDWDPAVIIPSHGMALGTTHRIRETLQHRIKRESQILELHQTGAAPEAMLPIIYAGLDPRLTPLALLNINSHLQKLRDEGRLPS